MFLKRAAGFFFGRSPEIISKDQECGPAPAFDPALVKNILSDRIFFGAGNRVAGSSREQDLARTITWVSSSAPREALWMFKLMGGRIRVLSSQEVDRACAINGAGNNNDLDRLVRKFDAFDSCVQLTNSNNTQFIDILVPDNDVVIRHSIVRGIGYAFANLVTNAHLVPDGQGAAAVVYTPNLQQNAQWQLKTSLAAAFMSELDASGLTSRKDFVARYGRIPGEAPAAFTSRIANDVFAHSFDSWFCRNHGTFSVAAAQSLKDGLLPAGLFDRLQNSRALFRYVFPKTATAFRLMAARMFPSAPVDSIEIASGGRAGAFLAGKNATAKSGKVAKNGTGDEDGSGDFSGGFASSGDFGGAEPVPPPAEVARMATTSMANTDMSAAQQIANALARPPSDPLFNFRAPAAPTAPGVNPATGTIDCNPRGNGDSADRSPSLNTMRLDLAQGILGTTQDFASFMRPSAILGRNYFGGAADGAAQFAASLPGSIAASVVAPDYVGELLGEQAGDIYGRMRSQGNYGDGFSQLAAIPVAISGGTSGLGGVASIIMNGRTLDGTYFNPSDPTQAAELGHGVTTGLFNVVPLAAGAARATGLARRGGTLAPQEVANLESRGVTIVTEEPAITTMARAVEPPPETLVQSGNPPSPLTARILEAMPELRDAHANIKDLPGVYDRAVQRLLKENPDLAQELGDSFVTDFVKQRGRAFPGLWDENRSPLQGNYYDNFFEYSRADQRKFQVRATDTLERLDRNFSDFYSEGIRDPVGGAEYFREAVGETYFRYLLRQQTETMWGRGWRSGIPGGGL